MDLIGKDRRGFGGARGWGRSGGACSIVGETGSMESTSFMVGSGSR